MSNHLLNRAWDVRGLTTTQKLILVRLADRADDDGYCFPGHESIAEDCELTGRTVRDNLPLIKDQGHITIHEETGRANKGKSRYGYTVHPLTAEAASGVTPEADAADTGSRRNPHRQGTTRTPETAAAPNNRTLNNPKENHHVNLVNTRRTQTGLTKLTTEKASKVALQRIARDIASNRDGWSYDNCKVQAANISAASLETVLLPYADKLTEEMIHACWAEAVTRTHRATVDQLANINPAGYAVACFKEQLSNASKTK